MTTGLDISNLKFIKVWCKIAPGLQIYRVLKLPDNGVNNSGIELETLTTDVIDDRKTSACRIISRE